jgi:hypothetical protein
MGKMIAMKKVSMIICLSLTIACGSNSEKAENNEEAAAEEEVDVGTGEDISPQLELDSSGRRFDVDTVSSSAEVDKETKKESV